MYDFLGLGQIFLTQQKIQIEEISINFFFEFILTKISVDCKISSDWGVKLKVEFQRQIKLQTNISKN